MPSEKGEAYSGQYYDGESAVAHEVIARCSSTVVVVSSGSRIMATWSYEDLLSPDPLRRGKRARLTHASAPYARLVVDQPGFADCILDRAPHLSAKAHNIKGLKLVIGCMLLAAALVGSGYAFLTMAPKSFARMMPDTWRDKLGEEVKSTLVGSRKHCVDENGLAALRSMEQRLSAKEPQPDQFKVFVYDMGFVNAFALPGGIILLSRQLIDAASDPEGVAGVLAHEMGHVIERDSEAQLVRLVGITVLQQILFGGSGIGESIGGLAGTLALFSYSRDAERGADAHANRILRNAEVDRDGLVKFFEYLMDKHGGSDSDGGRNLTTLFSTHPGLNERIESLTASPAWESVPLLTDNEWKALRSICSKAKKPEGNSSDSGENAE